MDNPQEIKREKVRVVPIKFIDDFPDHPFKVVDDERVEQLIRSIDLNGVRTPVIARKKEDERYELIFGHRRKHACEVLGLELTPMIVRDMSRDEATIGDELTEIGEYKVTVTDAYGNATEYDFTIEKGANIALIVILIILGVAAIGTGVFFYFKKKNSI